MTSNEIASIFAPGYTPEDLEQEFCNKRHIKESELCMLFDKVTEILAREPNVLYLDAPITVCGDIHGQIFDLFNLFRTRGVSPQDRPLLFLGDFVDRGYQSIETFAYLAYLKCTYPDKVYLLRGNHESRQVNQMYGLFNDCTTLYGHAAIWYRVNEVFDYMPIAAVIRPNIFCVHGGLSPTITLIEQLTMINRVKDIDSGPIADLTWSDPDTTTKFRPNTRGSGYSFGEEDTRRFLYNNRMLNDSPYSPDPFVAKADHGFIARSHQVAQQGYEWQHQNRLVIVWSAPNYTYKQNNKATFMDVPAERDEPIKFTEFTQDERSPQKPDDTVIEYFA